MVESPAGPRPVSRGSSGVAGGSISVLLPGFGISYPAGYRRAGVAAAGIVAPMGLHWQELIILLILALVVFGPKRLPEMGRSMGRAIREFKSSVSGAEASVNQVAAQIEAEVERPAPGTAAEPAPARPVADETPRT